MVVPLNDLHFQPWRRKIPKRVWHNNEAALTVLLILMLKMVFAALAHLVVQFRLFQVYRLICIQHMMQEFQDQRIALQMEDFP
jgi:hypothetical protein